MLRPCTILFSLALCLSSAVAQEDPPRPKLFQPGTLKAPKPSPAVKGVSIERVQQGLEELKTLLATRHAYSAIAPVPEEAFTAALARARELEAQRVTDQDPNREDDQRFITLDELGEVLSLVLAQSIDGHGSLSAGRFPRIGPALPLTLEPWEDATRTGETPIIALTPNRLPLDAESPTHTLLAAIDGKPAAEWLAAARKYVPKGTRQLQDRWAVGILPSIPLLRRWLDVPPPFDLPVLIKLADHEGKKPPIELEIALRSVPDAPTPWPDRESTMLQDGIAYLRLPSMIGHTSGLKEVRRTLDGFANPKQKGGPARALIIDLRNNGGGARDLIPLLADALLPKDNPPIVFTASRVLKLPGETVLEQKERTEHRDIYTRDDIRWNNAQRAAIDAFVAQYNPKTVIPEDRFAPLHFGLLSPSRDAKPVINGPIVVLMNGGCFSAADVCLAALAEFPNVTLMGQPSAGGSGFAEPVSIMGGLAQGRLSTMATFRKDGSLFDGVGISPDILVPTKPTDHIAGSTDTQLEAALAHLKSQLPP